jgi:hypothetical protein
MKMSWNWHYLQIILCNYFHDVAEDFEQQTK